MAEYQRGSGPKQLPQGAASAANAATPSPTSQMDIPVQYADPEQTTQLPPDSQASENMNILTASPHPNWSPDIGRSPGRPPRYLIRQLPRLMAAAKDPEAPQTLIAVYRAVVYELEKQSRMENGS